MENREKGTKFCITTFDEKAVKNYVEYLKNGFERSEGVLCYVNGQVEKCPNT